MTSPDKAPEDDAEQGPDELLVAYLDGQLDAAECERLESRLAEDGPTRERLQAFDRVWNALDALPRSTASPAFTRSTVEMAAVTAAEPARVGSRPSLWRPSGWLMASGIAALLGGMLAWALFTAPERRALRELPVALHASALEQAGSIEFLQELLERSAVSIESFRSEEIAQEAAEWGGLLSGTPLERSEWIAALPAADLASVNERLAAYQALPETKRSRLVGLCKQLADANNADELRQAALVYESLVKQLSASKQLRLREMEAEPRLRTIERQMPKWARQRQLQLTDTEKQRFRRAIKQASKNGGFARLLQGQFPGMPAEVRDRVRDRPHLAPIFITGLIANGARHRLPPFERGGRSDRAERVFEKISVAWRDWFDRVRGGLPTRVQGVLAQAPGDDERARLLIELLRDTGTSDLGSTFAELPNEQIDELLLLPREEFASALSSQSIGGWPEPGRRQGGQGFDRPHGPPPGFEFPFEGPPGRRPPFGDPRRPPPRRDRIRGEDRPPLSAE